jgi:hypothetical protein
MGDQRGYFVTGVTCALAGSLGGGSGGSARVQISDQEISASNPPIIYASATAVYLVSNDGNVRGGDGPNSGVVVLETWLLSGAAADFDVKVTRTGDLTSGDPTDVWMSLASGGSWQLYANYLQSKFSTLTVRIRDAVTLAELAVATVTLSAENL